MSDHSPHAATHPASRHTPDASIAIREPRTGQGDACAAILRALPQWFGIPEATEAYIRFTDENPTLTALCDGQIIGFLSLNRHFRESWEIHVMGVHPDHHRQGAGRALLDAAEVFCRRQGGRFLQVKTLDEASPDPYYLRTRAFYLESGFTPLEVFPTLWDPRNPCLQMIKAL